MQEPSHEMSSMELHIKQAPILWFGGMCPTIAPQPPVHIPPSAAWSAKAGDEFHLLSLSCKQDWNVSSIDRIEPHIIIAKISKDMLRSWNHGYVFCLNSPHLHVNFRDGCKALYRLS
jgi:hypothetical protein